MAQLGATQSRLLDSRARIEYVASELEFQMHILLRRQLESHDPDTLVAASKNGPDLSAFVPADLVGPHYVGQVKRPQVHAWNLHRTRLVFRWLMRREVQLKTNALAHSNLSRKIEHGLHIRQTLRQIDIAMTMSNRRDSARVLIHMSGSN